MSRASYNQVMTEFRGRLLSPAHAYHRMVSRVAERLIRVSGMDNSSLSNNIINNNDPIMNWEVNVIVDDSQVNAFVLPGGKIFVFTGLLNVIGIGNDDQLAAVLGHEIAHQLARHSAEKMSLFKMAFWLKLAVSLVISDPSVIFNPVFMSLAVHLPFSRKCEAEADYIGLLLMAQACYDPRQAIEFWARMREVHKGQGTQLLSTHPNTESRIAKLREWMPEAQIKYHSGNCHAYMHELDQMFVGGRNRWARW